MAALYKTRLTAWKQTETTEPRVGLNRSAAEQVKQWDTVNDDIAAIRTAFAAKDAVISIAQHVATVSGGTFTLTFTAPSIDGVGNSETFTTAAIAYNATAATIETAIDVAATSASITGWTNGDITVAEAGSAGLSDGACTFTCDGNSLDDMQVTASIDGSSLTGGGTAGAVTYTTYGQAAQVSKQALYDMNVVSGTQNDVGVAPSWTKPASNGQSRPRLALIKKLALDCALVDGSSEVYTEVLRLYPAIADIG
jgi:hypothetical protein